MPTLTARLLAATALAAAATLLVGSASSASGSGTALTSVRYGIVGTVSCLGNVNCVNAETVNANSLEPLQVIGQDHKVHPWLAQSVTEPNPTTYVYHLRHGVKFWDGDELTSADVVASLDYHKITAAYAYNAVQSIAASGKYTVIVKLKQPAASWPYQVANFVLWITEKKFLTQHGDAVGKPGTLVMGTGPWIVQSLDPTSGAELTANPHYWGGKVPFQHLSVKFFADETSEALAFRTHAIDIAIPTSPVSFNATAGIKSAHSGKLLSVPTPSVYGFSMNTQVAPWSDVHVRRAVAYALNSVDLAKANGGFATITHTFLSPYLLEALGTPAQVSQALKQVPIYTYNVAKAKAELAKSAYPNGFSFTLETFALGTWPQVNQVIAAELKAIGINATVKDVGSAAWYADIISGPKTRPAVFSSWGAASPDPSVFDWTFGTANTAANLWNIASWASPEEDALVNASVQTSDPAKRLVIYTKFLKLMAADMPIVPLFTQRQALALSNQIKWPTFDPFWFNRPWALEIKPA
jgi:peptide/nickel transport system substrate-binding protein